MGDYRVFEHPDFALHVPPDWENLTLSGFEAVFVAPPFADGSGANISISITEFPTITSLQEISDQLKAIQQQQYPEYRIIDERPFSLHQLVGFKRSYTWLNTVQKMPISQFQIVFIDQLGYKACILTATRPLGIEESEAQALDMAFSEISESFKFSHG